MNATMLERFTNHNLFNQSLKTFYDSDPHLHALSQLKHQYSSSWWSSLSFDIPGIYILTGGRQVGKSTSCKLAIKHCLQKKLYKAKELLYLPCDEIYDAQELSKLLRFFLDNLAGRSFFLIIDEITFVKDWDRVIKALADEGYFRAGICLLTGSDTLILKEAAMRFPGRRGEASQTDFHLYPLSFYEYVNLVAPSAADDNIQLAKHFQNYLLTGGYLRAINDQANHQKILNATFLTYEQWIRGDFLKQRKHESYLIAILQALITIGVSQISYSKITQKIGLVSKDTCIDYLRLLERMDILMSLQAFDQNHKQGFPRKDKKFHFCDPFIYQTIHNWLNREGLVSQTVNESTLVEAVVANHCHRKGKSFYFKGNGEVDVIWLDNNQVHAIEVKWANQLRPSDLKTLKQFSQSKILTKNITVDTIEDISCVPAYRFLYDIDHHSR